MKRAFLHLHIGFDIFPNIFLFVVTGDIGLPCSINIGSCPYCDNFLFFSEAEKQKHLSVIHHPLKGKFLLLNCTSLVPTKDIKSKLRIHLFPKMNAN